MSTNRAFEDDFDFGNNSVTSTAVEKVDTATSTRSTAFTLSPDWQQLKTETGLLKIVQLLISLLVCCLANSVQCTFFTNCSTPLGSGRSDFKGQAFVLFVGIVFLLGNVTWILVLLLVPRSKLPPITPLIEFVYVCSATFLYLIAACVESWYASMHRISDMPEWNPFRPAWIACAIFAWCNCFLYAFEILRHPKTSELVLKKFRKQSTTPTEVVVTSPIRQPEVYMVDKNYQAFRMQTLV